MSRLARRLLSVVALGVLLALAVGVPMLLALVAGWPLPRRLPDWGGVSTALRQGDVPGGVVVKVLAVPVWIAWAQLAWAVGWELVVNLPRANHGQRAQPAPLVPVAVSNGVGRLVALALSIGITLASTPTPSLARPSAAVSTLPRTSSTTAFVVDGSELSNVMAAEQTRSWRVLDGDNLWDIADTALGDGSRSSEIIDLNWQLRSPRDVRPGQLLRLPADASVPADRLPRCTPSDEVPSERVGYLPEVVVTVERGDTLWDLSENRLELASDEPVSGRSTIDYLDEVIAANPDTIENPNLIFPGEQFLFPKIGDAPVPVAPVAEDSPTLVPASPEAEPSVPVPITVVPATTPPSTAMPSTVAPRTATPGTTSSPAPAVPVIARPATTDTPPARRESAVPWLAGMTGATVLSAGALTAYRRRLRRRAARGERTIRADSAAHREVERQLVRVGDVSLVRWANHELADLARSLRPTDVSGTPVAVEMSVEHGLELLWDEPNPVAPEPWEAADGGWSWRLIYDADLHLPAVAETAPIPGLVTFGTRDGGTLLVNLEALGSLSVSGDALAVERFIRSLVFELSLSEELANSYLFLVGVDLEADPGLGRVSHATESEATSRIASVAGEHEVIIRAASLDSSFGLRVGGAADGRELTVVISTSDQLEDATAILTNAPQNRGVAVVLVGDAPALSTLLLDDDGSALLSPIGLRFDAVQLESEPVDGIVSLIQDSEAVEEDISEDEEEYEIDWPHALVEEALNDELGADDEWEPPVPTVLVKVLGPPRVDGHPSLGRLDVSLVAFLACNGGQATEDQVVNAVWGGRAIEKVTLWNRISKARVSLGTALPTREQGSSTIRLSDGVRTDLQVMKALAARAEQVSSGEAIHLLLEATALITGVPFDAAGYDWSYEHQFNAEACEAVESVCIRLAELALQHGDLGAARSAVGRGLKALPLNEPLYRWRMRAEAHAGNRGGVRAAFEELCNRLSDLDSASAPSASTSLLYDQLSSQSPKLRTA